MSFSLLVPTLMVSTEQKNLVLLITAAGNIYDTIITGTIPDTTLTLVKDTICGFSTISIKPEQTTVQKVILYDCK